MFGKMEGDLTLKLMINKEKTKVLFAEVDSDFVDVLLSFLTLPLGKTLKVISNHYEDEAPPTIGSLKSLHKSVKNLDDVHFWSVAGKMMLLCPINSFEKDAKYFTCGNRSCKMDRKNISMYYDTSRCPCGRTKTEEIYITDKNPQSGDDDNGVFTINTVSFLITDDLRVLPNVPGTIQNLTNLGIQDISGAQIITVDVKVDEIMDLLMGSLFSQLSLTDFFLHKRKIGTTTVKYETLLLPHRLDTKPTNKIIVKAMIQKSTNMFIFAQAGEDFVDFLFSFLTIPLVTVEHLLNGETFLGSIDNLYRSIYTDTFNFDKYFKSPYTKQSLLKLPPKYISKNQIFNLEEQTSPILYFNQDVNLHNWSVRFFLMYQKNESRVCLMDPKVEGSYVKPATFTVTDDLTITPSTLTSSLSIFDSLKIPIYDVKEVDIEIGFEEGLRILRASINSTYVLSEALFGSISDV